MNYELQTMNYKLFKEPRLIECSLCKAQISSSAITCPNCGDTKKLRRFEILAGIFFTLWILRLIIMLITKSYWR